MTRTWVRSAIVTLVLTAAVSEVFSPTPLLAESGELCPQVVAILTPHLGDPGRIRSGQRVEVRQCAISADIGTIQLVGWAARSAVPSLVIETELRSVKQLVMVRGAYAFELVSAAASGVIGIVFDKGQPIQAVRDSTKGTVVIRSEEASITVELDDGTGAKRIHVLKGDDSRP